VSDTFKSLRPWLLLATVAGLAATAWILSRTGWSDVLAQVARIRLTGFGLFCLWFMGVFVILGAAWHVVARGEPQGRVWLFVAARMLREAAADLLPFSHAGGIVLGVRLLTSHGVPQQRANGGLLVDLTTEMASQVVFSCAGIAVFLATVTGGTEAAHLRPLILGGTLVMLAGAAAFAVAQRAGLRLAGRVAASVLPGAAAATDAILAELRAIYDRPGLVLRAFAFNLLAWTGSALGAWIGLRLMGVPASIWSMLMVESLIFTLRSMAFFIPGALGVQEFGYLLLAPIAQIPAEALLALSLVERARDLAIGVPTLVCWQLTEMRALLAR